MQTTTNTQTLTAPIVKLVLLWLAYCIFTILVQNYSPLDQIYANVFITSFESLLDLVVAFYAFWIWNTSQNHYVKTIFMLFTFGFLFDAFSCAFYNFDMYVLQLNYFTVSFVVSSLYNAPYVITLLLDFIAWTLILRNIKNPQVQIKSKIFNYIPIYLIIITFVLTTLFQYTSIRHHLSFAPHLIYDYVQFIFYVSTIILVLLCSALTQNTSIFLMACGYIISLGTSIGVDLGITATPFGSKNILEFGWVLGTFFIVYGMHSYQKHTVKYKQEPNTIL